MDDMKYPIIILAIALACFFVFLWFSLPILVDDAFIGFRYAKHLAEGNGIVWNVGEPPVEGYSDFLWVVIMSAVYPLDFVITSRVLALVSLLGILAAYYSMTKRFDKPKLAFSIAALLFIANPATTLHAMSGMSTMMNTMLLVITVFLAYLTYEKPSPKLMAFFSVSALALTLARPEGGLPSIVMAAIIYWKNRSGLKIFLSAYIAPVAVYLLWKLYYFGSIFPLTFQIKTAVEFSLRGVPTLIRNIEYLAPLLLVIVIAIFVFEYPRLKRFFFLSLAGTFSFIFIYLFSGLAQNVMQRFYYPAFAVIYLIAGIAAVKITNKKHVLVMIALIMVCANIGFVDELREWHFYGQAQAGGYAALGRSLRGSNLTIAGGDAGALSYYSDLRFIDMAGHNDVEVAKTKIAPMWYVEQTSPDILVFMHDAPEYCKSNITEAFRYGWRSVPFYLYGKENNFTVRLFPFYKDKHLIVMARPELEDFIQSLEPVPGYFW